MFHAWFYLLSYVLSTLWSNFHMISWTNLLTRCHSASCMFSAVFGSRKSENEYSQHWTGQKPKFLFYRKNHGARIRDRGGQGLATPPRRGLAVPVPPGGVGPWHSTDLALSPIRSLRCINPKSSSFHPRICSHQSHVFASPMDPISMGEGSQESMKEGG